MVAGPREVIARVRKARKMLGGGMRQVGVLAAAALVALDEMVDRLAEDHANARLLAEGLAAMPGIHVDLSTVATNIVDVPARGGDRRRGHCIDGLEQEGVLIVSMGGPLLRAVTHHGITAADCDCATLAVRPRPRADSGAGDAVKAQSMIGRAGRAPMSHRLAPPPAAARPAPAPSALAVLIACLCAVPDAVGARMPPRPPAVPAARSPVASCRAASSPGRPRPARS